MEKTPAEKAAESLREQADKIEEAEIQRIGEHHRNKRIFRLEECIKTVIGKHIDGRLK